ncbi:MAG: hypothetical protein MH252_18460 [Thermosynechococcaceae cyanobacterium MS004]|nr:hypothetical protein [Thermosynechococcaceae cyanobacterium MS004]
MLGAFIWKHCVCFGLSGILGLLTLQAASAEEGSTLVEPSPHAWVSSPD